MTSVNPDRSPTSSFNSFQLGSSFTPESSDLSTNLISVDPFVEDIEVVNPPSLRRDISVEVINLDEILSSVTDFRDLDNLVSITPSVADGGISLDEIVSRAVADSGISLDEIVSSVTDFRDLNDLVSITETVADDGETYNEIEYVSSESSLAGVEKSLIEYRSKIFKAKKDGAGIYNITNTIKGQKFDSNLRTRVRERGGHLTTPVRINFRIASDAEIASISLVIDTFIIFTRSIRNLENAKNKNIQLTQKIEKFNPLLKSLNISAVHSQPKIKSLALKILLLNKEVMYARAKKIAENRMLLHIFNEAKDKKSEVVISLHEIYIQHKEDNRNIIVDNYIQNLLKINKIKSSNSR